jgi:hypothetical protein
MPEHPIDIFELKTSLDFFRAFKEQVDLFETDKLGSITRFLQRERPLSALGSLPVKLEDTLKSPVVFGAPQRHHQVDSLHQAPERFCLALRNG